MNTADPRLNKTLGNCLTEKLAFTARDAAVQPVAGQGGSQAVSLDKATQKELLACHDDFVKRQKESWNAQSWMIGVAVASVTENGKVDSLEGDGIGIWTSYTRQFTFGRTNGVNAAPKSDPRRGQFILHGRYRTSEKVKPEGSDVMIDQDSSLFGARIRIGAPEFGGSLETSYLRKDPDGGKSDTHLRVLLGMERLLFGSTWLDFAAGRDVGRQDGDDVVIRSAFRWSFSQSRPSS